MKKLSILVLLTTLLISILWGQVSSGKLLIYDGEKEDTSLSSIGFWVSPEGCKAEEIKNIAHFGEKSIKVYFKWNSWWAGMGLNWAKWSDKDKIFDLSNFDKLELWIKAESENNVTLLLTLAQAPKVSEEKEKYSDKVTISSGIPTSWTRFSIPLSQFKGIDLKRIWGMSVEVTGLPQGELTFYVDDIVFLK